jgi:uncharacterized protein (TIGR04222 family)
MLPYPFNLPGPDFLLFYLVFSFALLLFFYLLRRGLDRGDQQTPLPLEDPYEIAFLRGGRSHLLDVAMINLIDRGFLLVSDKELKTADREDIQRVRRPLEKQILELFLWKSKASTLFSDPAIRQKCKAIEHSLQQKGFLPSASQRLTHLTLFMVGLVILWTLSGVKILYALSRGHHNVIFLIMLSVIMVLPLYWVTRTFRSRAGEREYARLKEQLQGLYNRRTSLEPHQSTNELALLAALFGLSALPAIFADEIKPLQLREAGSSGWGGGCSGGSSCSSGGGSCGGGGCGGGCGGCG